MAAKRNIVRRGFEKFNEIHMQYLRFLQCIFGLSIRYGKCYTNFVLIIIFILLFWICFTAIGVYVGVTPISVLDVVSYVNVTVTNVISVYFAYKHRSIFKEFDGTLERVKGEYKNKLTIQHKRDFERHGLYSHIVISTHFFVDCYCYTDYFGTGYMKRHFVYLFDTYAMFLTLIRIYYYSSLLHTLFRSINVRILENFYGKRNDEDVYFIRNPAYDDSLKNVLKSCIQTHAELSNLIDKYGKMFEGSLWGIYNSIVYSILYVTVIFLLPITTARDLTYRTVCMGLRLAVYITFAIFITMPCDKAAREARRTGEICNKLLIDVERGQRNLDSNTQKYLLVLSRQVKHQNPTFSITDISIIDCTMLVSIGGSISGYITILLQFPIEYKYKANEPQPAVDPNEDLASFLMAR